jgi:hypothetical protein
MDVWEPLSAYLDQRTVYVDRYLGSLIPWSHSKGIIGLLETRGVHNIKDLPCGEPSPFLSIPDSDHVLFMLSGNFLGHLPAIHQVLHSKVYHSMTFFLSWSSAAHTHELASHPQLMLIHQLQLEKDMYSQFVECVRRILPEQ